MPLISVKYVKADAASCQLPSGNSTLGNTLFSVLCVTFWGSLPNTFLLLMCAALFISIYGSQGSVDPFSRVRRLSGSFYSMSGCIQKVDSDRYVLLTSTFTRITHAGSMMCFSNSQRLLRQAHTSHRCIKPKAASD